MTRQEIVDTVLRETQPLRHSRAGRLPLYVWGLRGAPDKDDGATESLLRSLDERGMALLSPWLTGKGRDDSLREALRVARLQRKLGLSVGVDAIRPLYMFFNGEAATAHADEAGEPFFDLSFQEKTRIGCPFSVKHRYAVIREQVEFFTRAYQEQGIKIDFAFSDWEIDGPIEWNQGWANAKKCARCRKHIADIDDFASFQAAYRRIRSEMQRECYAEPILAGSPDALVGNYGVYPCDGRRYWYDWFEVFNPELPHHLDQREPVRPWVHEFADTAFTFAMPVLYTWHRIHDWYDFANSDYRWVYNMLKVASNAGAHTPASTPIISFVHHTLIAPAGREADPHVKPMTVWAYKELLWHALLRGHDTFFLWCPNDQTSQELRPLHEVWSESLAYNEFILEGTPVTFDVPKQEGPVVSALRLGSRFLVRRTDFAGSAGPASLAVDGRRLSVPAAPGTCRILELPAP